MAERRKSRKRKDVSIAYGQRFRCIAFRDRYFDRPKRSEVQFRVRLPAIHLFAKCINAAPDDVDTHLVQIFLSKKIERYNLRSSLCQSDSTCCFCHRMFLIKDFMKVYYVCNRK